MIMRVTLALAFLLSPTLIYSQELQLFSVGSGNLSGGYFPTAKVICEAFNSADATPRRCSPEPTAGSIYNLTMLHAGELDFALVQSDWLRAAYLGTGPFSDTGSMDDLRSVLSLFPEAITILAAPGSGIATSDDLAEKVVDLGLPASGRNATVRGLLKEFGMDETLFGGIREFESYQAIKELCAGRIDAAIFVVGHPNDLVAEAVMQCNASIVSLTGPNVDQVASENMDYRKIKIDVGLYNLPAAQVETLAVFATLVTRASVDENLVADLVSAVRNNIDAIRASSPLLQNLDRYFSASDRLSVPVHSGAAKAVSNKTIDQ